MRQQQALAVMMQGDNVFLTGAPGAGKTYVLNQFIERAKRAGKRVAVTASTGIAASHLNGTTIHSWSGLGILDQLNGDDLRRLGASDKLVKRYNSTDCLVIDEVSMLHGARLNMVNTMAKLLRASDKPFGGMQVILVGDLFQLPPVSRGTREVDFVHVSEAWAELDPKICYITEQHRQQDNDALLNLLEAMRRNEIDVMHQELITSRLKLVPAEDLVVTRLYAHNIDVEAINQKYLAALEGPSKQFMMQTKGGRPKVEQLTKSLLAPEILELKVGAEVMFVANNFADGYVNGSRGKITSLEGGRPQVRLMNGRLVLVEQAMWSLTEDGSVRAEASQLPLRLAWAITIHKSQGMSLDAAEIDLSRAFTPGMGYVALSRVRSVDGLYLQGINAMAMAMHPQIHDFDRELRSASTELAAVTDDITAEAIVTAAEREVAVPKSELLSELQTWRQKRAAMDHIPAYMIAHNTALEAVASYEPTSSQQLLATPGFGRSKVDAYGPEILAIVAKHSSAK